ncbi:imidazolonepropionase-like domain-containing protein [Streptomyces sp. NPDC101132]|uniref:imidazolonepropionase-like domain-containing protein n=1 Tax=Streptomyces sp. NPDC101132 TaxID=3366110 RepID=UPI003813FA4D
MRTLHAAPLVLPVGAPPVPDGAVLAEGDRLVAVGPQAELAETYPTARIREWPGVITPGLRQPRAGWLLRHCYFPDPREAELLGTEPLSPAETSRLAPDASRMGGSVRRGLQQMLRYGTTAVAVPAGDALLGAPVARLGLRVVVAAGDAAARAVADAPDAGAALAAPDVPGALAALAAPDVPDALDAFGAVPDALGAVPDLDPLSGLGSLASAVAGPLVVGGPADFAVFDAGDEGALLVRGAGTCVATVLGGRLLYRGR